MLALAVVLAALMVVVALTVLAIPERGSSPAARPTAPILGPETARRVVRRALRDSGAFAAGSGRIRVQVVGFEDPILRFTASDARRARGRAGAVAEGMIDLDTRQIRVTRYDGPA